MKELGDRVGESTALSNVEKAQYHWAMLNLHQRIKLRR